jgi:hypothetical protein
MYDLTLVKIIHFTCRFAVINEKYSKNTPQYFKKHAISLVNFLQQEFIHDVNDKNDSEILALLGNFATWLQNTNSFDLRNKVSLKLPETINKLKWTHSEIEMFSNNLKNYIHETGYLCFKKKELENPLGLLEWLVSMFLHKYQDNNLKILLSMFNESVMSTKKAL